MKSIFLSIRKKHCLQITRDGNNNDDNVKKIIVNKLAENGFDLMSISSPWESWCTVSSFV